MQRPIGITLVAVLFAVAALYLWTIGVVLLVAPGAISLMAGKYFAYGLEIAGPYMILLVGSCYAVIVGIVSSAQLGTLDSDASDRIQRHAACSEDLDGRAWLADFVVRIADRAARRSRMVSRTGTNSTRRLRE